MTKKERAAFDAALAEARLLGALRWTTAVERDVLPVTGGYVSGWDWNAHSGRVWLGWSSSISHGSGPIPVGTARHMSGSQGSRRMQSTKERALAALRHEMELQFATALAAVDRQIREAAPVSPTEHSGQIDKRPA